MDLPVGPPLTPMLARLVRELPAGDGWRYEPKWDGFRGLAFCAGDAVDLRSRNQRPLARYFPELVAGLRPLGRTGAVLDGEILVTGDDGFDFNALLARLHPARSRVERLAQVTPACFVAFDLVALGADDLRPRPFAERRALLERTLAGCGPPVFLTPTTDDRATAAAWLAAFTGGGVDGVVAKPDGLTYQPGRRAMVKVKRERTAECVVAGFRWFADQPVLGSLLLGLYDGAGGLRHVGVASSFSGADRVALLTDLAPHAVPLAGHPWQHGFALEGGPTGRLKGAAGRWTPDLELDWVPLRPELVAEVAYGQVDGLRLRYPARFRRWRPDRDARSCTTDQLAPADGPDAAAVLARRP